MKTFLLKLLGFYREPDESKKEAAKVKPITRSQVPAGYLALFPANDLNKINKDYHVV